MLSILYEDDALLFINKPAGVVIQPSLKEDEPYLLKDVLQHAPGAFLMQRLDRGTTGVMFFSKLGAINAKLTRQFETKEIRKRYLALLRVALRFPWAPPAIGVDSGRVALLTAVLERKQGIVLSDQDIYVNVAGGATLEEPAADLAVAAALASSFRDVPLDPRTVILGEVGLAGEVRGVTQIEQRLGEAAQLGFVRCILPESNARRITGAPLELCGVGTLGAAMEALLT